MRREYLLLGSLLAVAAMFVYARTERGAVLAADAVGLVVDAMTPRGIRNNNPGNLIRTGIQWRGKVYTESEAKGLGLPWDARFEVFKEAKWGVRALGRDLLSDASRGATTVRKLISQYAPPHENDTESYIESVAKSLRVGADEAIPVRDSLPVLAAAIIRHKNGRQPYTEAQLREWVYLS